MSGKKSLTPLSIITRRAESRSSMSPDQNLALVHRLLDEVNNKHNLAVANELVAPAYILHDPGNPNFSDGRAGYKQFQTGFTQAFPDHQLTFDAEFAAGDLVVT